MKSNLRRAAHNGTHLTANQWVCHRKLGRSHVSSRPVMPGVMSMFPLRPGLPALVLELGDSGS